MHKILKPLKNIHTNTFFYFFFLEIYIVLKSFTILRFIEIDSNLPKLFSTTTSYNNANIETRFEHFLQKMIKKKKRNTTKVKLAISRK